MFPDHVGLELKGKSNGREYYMLEIHYDNPDMIDGTRFETGVQIYYTNETRLYLLKYCHLQPKSL